MDMADMDMMLHTMTHPMVPLRTLLDANFPCRDVRMSRKDQDLLRFFKLASLAESLDLMNLMRLLLLAFRLWPL